MTKKTFPVSNPFKIELLKNISYIFSLYFKTKRGVQVQRVLNKDDDEETIL